jgi:Fe2+ transport system protein FeoA
MITKPLNKMIPGENGMIVKIRGKPDMHRILSRMGLVIGRSICIENSISLTNACPILVSSGRLKLCVDLTEAANIYVDLT